MTDLNFKRSKKLQIDQMKIAVTLVKTGFQFIVPFATQVLKHAIIVVGSIATPVFVKKNTLQVMRTIKECNYINMLINYDEQLHFNHSS